MKIKQRGPRYRPIMSIKEVVQLLKLNVYHIDTECGVVTNQKGKQLTPYVGNDEGHLFIRIYHTFDSVKKVKTIAVHRLVWMVVTQQPIPYGFEIHHRDEDTKNNAWDNLLCVHALDHKKLHGVVTEEEIPF